MRIHRLPKTHRQQKREAFGKRLLKALKKNAKKPLRVDFSLPLDVHKLGKGPKPLKVDF